MSSGYRLRVTFLLLFIITSFLSTSMSQTTISAQAVQPRPISDKTYLDNVIGFIQTTVPTSYASRMTKSPEPSDPVYWLKFLEADVNNPILLEYKESEASQRPLLFALGYSSSVVVWLIRSAKSEAEEVFSLDGSFTSVFELLKTPQLIKLDKFGEQRPLVLLNSSSRRDVLQFYSLINGEEVHQVNCHSEIISVSCSDRVILVGLSDKIIVIDSDSLKLRFWLKTFPKPTSALLNPNALGDRWLAFADTNLHDKLQSLGGNKQENTQSYTATVLNAAKTLSSATATGFKFFGETVGKLTGVTPIYNKSSPSRQTQQFDAGIVSIIDLESVYSKREELIDISRQSDPQGVIAHFRAQFEALAELKFDTSGLILVTACVEGRDFNVFSIQPHPWSIHLCLVQHLYVLHRGDTCATIQHIHFRTDSRWISVSTLRGTSHIFPLSTYGGPITVRTHTSSLVVNKLSRFHMSAGLDESNLTAHSSENVLSIPGLPAPSRWSNPWLKELITPIVIQSMALLKPPAAIIPSNDQQVTGTKLSPPVSRAHEGGVCLASYFGAPFTRPRTCSGGMNISESTVSEALYLLTGTGYLLEHKLIPTELQVTQGLPSQESPIQLRVQGVSEWCLIREPDRPAFNPPLSQHSPLLVTARLVRSIISKDTDCDEFSYQPPVSIDMVKNKEWLTNVETVTYAPPGRRIWMGPQFSFKTYQPRPVSDYLVYSSSPHSNTSEEMDRYNSLTIPYSSSADPPLIDLFHTDISETNSLPLHVRRSEPLTISISHKPESWISAEGTSDETLEVYGSWKDYAPTAGNEEMGTIKEMIIDAMEESYLFYSQQQQSGDMVRYDSPLTGSASPDSTAIFGSLQSLDRESTPVSGVMDEHD